MSTYRLLGKLQANQYVVGARKWVYLFPATSRIAHTKLCPANKGASPNKGGPPDKGGAAAATPEPNKIEFPIRGEPAPVRLAFVPETFFTFFRPKTGVTGPYIFLFVVANYLLSKEIYILEHEYYSGLSIFIMVAFAYKKFATPMAKWLDEEVDAVSNSWQKLRTDELNVYNDLIKDAKDAVMRAEAQSMLINAKKENVQMQLEAIFRERSMYAYEKVKERMDYHIKRHQAESRIHQKWMIGWILENVRKSITPEFQQQAFDAAIVNLEALAAKGGNIR